MGLYHGWLVDPQDDSSVTALGKCSYNQLVEKIIQFKGSDNDDKVREGKIEHLVNKSYLLLGEKGERV